MPTDLDEAAAGSRLVRRRKTQESSCEGGYGWFKNKEAGELERQVM